MKFFIVTPSFNQGEFIGQTLDSVAQQKGDFEVIHWVIDGGSTDKTAQIVKKYPDVGFLSEKDEGQTDALNKGLAKLFDSKLNLNEVIFAYINSDDYYLSTVFEKVVKEFNDPAVDWVMGDAKIVNKNGRQIQFFTRLYKWIWRCLLQFCPKILFVLNPISQPATFMRASLVKETGLFEKEYHYVMDYDYWLRLVKKGIKPIVISRPLAAFRIHPQSKGGTGFNHQFNEQLVVAKKYTQNLFLLWLQIWHNRVTVWIYGLIK